MRLKTPMTEARALDLIVGKARNSHHTIGEANDAVKIVRGLLDFNNRARAAMAVKFPWLLDADEPANGADTVDAVREWFVAVGGVVTASTDDYKPTNYFKKGVVVDRI